VLSSEIMLKVIRGARKKKVVGGKQSDGGDIGNPWRGSLEKSKGLTEKKKKN